MVLGNGAELYSKSQLSDPIWYHRRHGANLNGFWMISRCPIRPAAGWPGIPLI